MIYVHAKLPKSFVWFIFGEEGSDSLTLPIAIRTFVRQANHSTIQNSTTNADQSAEPCPLAS
jgi:hypothetical protein